MWPFNWNGGDYDEEIRINWRNRIERKKEMYGFNSEEQNENTYEKITQLKNMIKKQKDITGKKIHIGDKVVYIEPYIKKINLNIGKVIKINKQSIVVQPLLFNVNNYPYTVKNMCVIIK